MSKLFSDIKIKDLELKNRIVMAPMCMVMANEKGYASDWHTIHYGSRAIGGSGLIILEAIASICFFAGAYDYHKKITKDNKD